jgi:hypothetical protein
MQNADELFQGVRRDLQCASAMRHCWVLRVAFNVA